MQAELIAIGSELTSGHTVNTNAAVIARRLHGAGLPCPRQTAIADEPSLMIETIRTALARSEVVLLTGGLGPTFDDLTMEAIARATGRALRYMPQAARQIRRFYRASHRHITRAALRQACLPEGAVALPNPIGTAPGMWLRHEGRLLVALPGVPREMETILEASVVPRLRRLTQGAAIVSRTLRTVGLVELQIQAILKRLSIPPQIQLGLYPHLMTVDVRLTAVDRSRPAATRLLDRLERVLRLRLGAAVYGREHESLEEVVGRALAKHRLTLAVAESCTGGLVSDRLTNVPGSSRYLLMGVVAYHNRIKADVLHVPARLLKQYGAVSAQVARAMAQGIRARAGAALGLAITGIAGPTGATATKPVGLVYLALADARTTRVKRCRFHGDRLAIKHQTAQLALDWIRRCATAYAPARHT